MEESGSAIEGAPSTWRSLVTWKSVAATIAGLTAVLIALQSLSSQIPATMDAIKKARAALFGNSMSPSPPQADGMQGSHPATPAVVMAQPAIESSDLGPRPGPNCEIFVSTDYSVFPPKSTRSWRC
jgi:hypothetical protein